MREDELRKVMKCMGTRYWLPFFVFSTHKRGIYGL